MANSAFRIAFWALFVSLWFCLGAALMSPQARLALQIPASATSFAENSRQEEPVGVLLGSPQPFPGNPRLASADEAGGWLTPPSANPGLQPVPQLSERDSQHSNPSVAQLREVPSPYHPFRRNSAGGVREHSPSDSYVGPPASGEFRAVDLPIEPARESAVEPFVPVQPPVRLATPLVEPQPWLAQPARESTQGQSASPTLTDDTWLDWPDVPRARVFEELPPPPERTLSEVLETSQPNAESQLTDAPATRAELPLEAPVNSFLPLIEREAADELVTAMRDLREELTRWSSLRLPEALVAGDRLAVADDWSHVADSASRPGRLTTLPPGQAGELPVGPTNPRTRVSPGPTEGRWTFDFHQTPLPEALRAVATAAGHAILIEPGVGGEVTQAFEDVEPKQTFALLIKMYGLGVDYRGSQLLLKSRRHN
jgi:hypothetical protein